ncbi:MAG: alpha/beta fold hydrolase, partial [Steroidobacteraceae bacterium]
MATLCAAGPCFAAPAAGGARLALTACRLEHPSHLVSVQAQCGYLSVPENPFAANGRGRQIRLFVARIPAVSLHARPDPLFLLAGGPGAAAATLYTEAAAPFARIHRDRDIVLVDQRGTGRSNGLFCKSEDDASLGSGTGSSTLGPEPSTSAVVADARQCLAALSKHADVAFYTTSVAVRDLDRVRAALGYGKIDLYGVSYGTRVAQEYLRRFPRHVRAVILDGVVPPQIALGAALPLNAQHALDAIFTRCIQDRACDARFGDPAAMSHRLRSALALAPVQVQLADPT